MIAPWVIYSAIVAASTILSFALAPRTKVRSTLKPGDIDTPTAEEGVEITVLFGTRYIGNPNVVWYGDIKTIAIRKKGGKK